MHKAPSRTARRWPRRLAVLAVVALTGCQQTTQTAHQQAAEPVPVPAPPAGIDLAKPPTDMRLEEQRWLTVVRYAEGRYAEAEAVARLAADKAGYIYRERGEDYALAMANLGAVLAMRGSLDEAAFVLGIAISRVTPSDQRKPKTSIYYDAHANMGFVTRAQGRLKAAAGHLKIASIDRLTALTLAMTLAVADDMAKEAGKHGSAPGTSYSVKKKIKINDAAARGIEAASLNLMVARAKATKDPDEFVQTLTDSEKKDHPDKDLGEIEAGSHIFAAQFMLDAGRVDEAVRLKAKGDALCREHGFPIPPFGKTPRTKFVVAPKATWE